MGIIKDRFKEKADLVAADIKDILKEHGEKVIGEVTLSHVLSKYLLYLQLLNLPSL